MWILLREVNLNNNTFNKIYGFKLLQLRLKLGSLNIVKDMGYLYFIDDDWLLLSKYL